MKQSKDFFTCENVANETEIDSKEAKLFCFAHNLYFVLDYYMMKKRQ